MFERISFFWTDKAFSDNYFHSVIDLMFYFKQDQGQENPPSANCCNPGCNNDNKRQMSDEVSSDSLGVSRQYGDGIIKTWILYCKIVCLD